MATEHCTINAWYFKTKSKVINAFFFWKLNKSNIKYYSKPFIYALKDIVLQVNSPLLNNCSGLSGYMLSPLT